MRQGVPTALRLDVDQLTTLARQGATALAAYLVHDQAT